MDSDLIPIYRYGTHWNRSWEYANSYKSIMDPFWNETYDLLKKWHELLEKLDKALKESDPADIEEDAKYARRMSTK